LYSAEWRFIANAPPQRTLSFSYATRFSVILKTTRNHSFDESTVPTPATAAGGLFLVGDATSVHCRRDNL